ncbi:restriction endonuclease subunit S [Paraburkholderia sediminicola]|uniref:restriction endonuclease subunit S n=1 Tax=Paraburkholderia sediminicola TaxID=458836 RepID=UPI0038B969FA
MKPYPSYKPSGVPWVNGCIPGHWEIKKVKHIASMRSGEGITAESIEDSGSYPVYGGNGLRGYTENSTHEGEFVLIGRQGALCGNVHHVKGEFWASEHAVVSDMYAGDSPRWTTYMFEFMNLGQYSIAAAQPGLAVDRILQLLLPVPPTEEQQAIADYLDTETARIDELIREKDELIGLLREAQSSAFSSAIAKFSGLDSGSKSSRFPWLDSFPLTWRVAKVKHLTQSVDQGISPQCESYPPDDGQWGVLKVGCVNSGDFNPLESKALPSDVDPIESITLKKGDVLISRANTKNLVGRAAMANRDYPRLMLSDKHYRLRPDLSECEPQFLVFVLTHPAVRVFIEERATGASASMLNIDQRTIMDLEIPLPPLNIQQQIIRESQADRDALAKLMAHTNDEIALLKELRAATVADAVLGRVDVRTTKQ